MNALIVTLLVVLAVYDVTATGATGATGCPVCDAAANNQPVNGDIKVQDGLVCCISQGEVYLCQTAEAAKADGGLLNTLLNGAVVSLLNDLSLCKPVKMLLDGLLPTLSTALISTCNGQTLATGVQCNPPPKPTTPVTPTNPTPYCDTTCASGLCCEANNCPK